MNIYMKLKRISPSLVSMAFHLVPTNSRNDGWVPSRGRATATSLLLVSLSYYLAAETAFAIGTLTQMFAPFWPPNVVLLCTLLMVPPSQWWLFIVAVFPAHVA